MCRIINYNVDNAVIQALYNGNDFWWQSYAEFTIAQIRINRSNCFDVAMLKVVQMAPDTDSFTH